MKISALVLLLLSHVAFSQNFETKDIQINDLIYGTLYSPKNIESPKLAIIVAGSGLTDRNGNAQNQGLKTDMYKLLAEALSEDMAVFSYDKSVIHLLKTGKIAENIPTFISLVDDLNAVVQYFRQKDYKHITLIGHSEGALLSTLAAQKDADALVSLSGAGQSIDLILLEQLKKQLPMLEGEIINILTRLKQKEVFDVENQMLKNVFLKHNQPYIIEWMQYDPQEEIKKVSKPILIINGAKDIQVSNYQAELLKSTKADANLCLLPNMTHTLKNISNDNEQMKSYTDNSLPIANDLVKCLKDFLFNQD
jgi:pimeloyl-ACP methyl ester carboxylesterase